MDSDKYRILSSSILQCDLDIIGLAETHLRDDNVPFIEGFQPSHIIGNIYTVEQGLVLVVYVY